jgi:hypothetical protein
VGRGGGLVIVVVLEGAEMGGGAVEATGAVDVDDGLSAFILQVSLKLELWYGFDPPSFSRPTIRKTSMNYTISFVCSLL